MRTTEKSLKTSLRQVLAKTGVSAVAVALLLVWSLRSLVRALWGPALSSLGFLMNAIGVLGIPDSVHTWGFNDRLLITTMLSYLLYGLLAFASAWLLSHWAYGTGPIHCLGECHSRLKEVHHV